VVFVIVIVAASFAFGLRLTAASAILLNAVATCVALLFAWSFQKSIEPAELSRAEAVYAPRLWLSTAFGLMWISVANMILSQQIDVLVVGTFMGTREAGIYGLASQISNLLRIAGASIVYVTLPYVADLHARGDTEKLNKVVKWAVGVGTVLGVAGFLGVLLLGRYVLAWFGEGFGEGYAVLLILSAVWVIDASFGNLGGFLLTLTGHHNRAGVITVVSAILNMTLMVVLIPSYGAIGAASATLIANSVKLVAFARAAKARVGVDVFALYRMRRR
jgi:O-antigen/teichoic acid export membrane protein